MNPDTHPLPSTVRPERKTVEQPKERSRWAISSGAIASAALWMTDIVLLARDRSPTVTTTEMAVFAVTSVGTVLTAMFARGYVVGRSVASDHQLIREEIGELRGLITDLRVRLVVAAGETRTAINDVSKEQTGLRQLYWEGLAESLASESETNGHAVLPFGRRRS